MIYIYYVLCYVVSSGHITDTLLILLRAATPDIAVKQHHQHQPLSPNYQQPTLNPILLTALHVTVFLTRNSSFHLETVIKAYFCAGNLVQLILLLHCQSLLRTASFALQPSICIIINCQAGHHLQRQQHLCQGTATASATRSKLLMTDS